MPESAKITQRNHFDNIIRLSRNFGKDGKDRHSLGYFEARIQRLDELWKACPQLHGTVLHDTAHSSDLRSGYLAEFEEAEDVYLDLLTKYKAGMSDFRRVGVEDAKQPTVRPSTTVQLERITIPKFDGSYGKWRMFNDLFTSMVDKNEGLSAAEKMQYLSTHLTGEAARVIQHMEISNDNYGAAWEILRKRFDNKRAIAWSFLQKFHNLPKAKEDCDASIKNLMDSTAEFVANMRSIGMSTEHWDLLIIYSISQKLDHQSRRLWETSLGASADIPDLETFLEFLTSRFRTLEALDVPKKGHKIEAFAVRETTVCNMCQKNHYVGQCDTFKTMNTLQRKERCRTCSKKHHTLLHASDNNVQHTELSAHAKSFTSTANSLLAEETANCQTVLLATALIKVKTATDEFVTLRALIDSGSQRTFVTESAAQLLNIKRQYSKFQVYGLGATSKIQTKGSIPLTIKPKYGETAINASALVIPNITNICPAVETQFNTPKTLSSGDLADPLCGTPGRIDILLGADVYNSIILPGFKEGCPCAVKTRFGWILLGPTQTPRIHSGIVSLISTEDKMDELIQRFWEITESPPKPLLTATEKAAADWYEKTTSRDATGRYVVRLPFRQDAHPDPDLHSSQQTARIRFSQLEKRLASDAHLKKQYHTFMEEYLSLGHMVEVPSQDRYSGSNYYLPHHAVLKEESTTTKLRVVFNASQSTPSGKSLNDTLLIGPSIQNNIVHILMRWRTYKYVIAADIEKMFRQIAIHPQDQDFQRILWRNHPSEPIRHYKLTTVTYGTASAPYLAIRTLHQLAGDEQLTYPQACQSLKRDFYVDDVLTGGGDIEEVKTLQRDLVSVLNKGGFKLRKWTANDNYLLSSIPISDRETKTPLDIEMTDHIKTLGLRWHPARDSFFFKVNLKPITFEPLTKRKLLSEVAQLYDPLGWLQPCIVVGKITIQRLWLEKTGWDEAISVELEKEWRTFRAQLPVLQNISIPRWLQYVTSESIQIHGFCDASEAAYAAVIYIRVQGSDDTTSVTLLTSTSKVAPVKVQSIPRLELCGAELLCSLMKTTLEAHGWSHIKPYYWTDSMIVLQWLQSPPAKWKVFVANRVSKIQCNSDIKQWEHVSSKLNPADIASRGTMPHHLVNNKLWWNGPYWLSEPRNKWPKTHGLVNTAMVNEEARPKASCLVNIKVVSGEDTFQRFSSFSRLIRVIAYCRRWITKSKNSFLTTTELREAEMACVRLIQQEAFSNEISLLGSKKPLPKTSPLIRLSPTLDPEHLLRVGGRIQQSAVNQDMKHPILLPRGHLANLIIKHYHHLILHGGCQLVHATIRTKYWIVNGLSAVKTITRKCITCFRVNAKPSQQLMGELPYERIQPGKPFARTGIDYAGPIIIKWSGGRGTKTTKAYIAVFVCLSTKAVHLELASDLTSKTCIAAIRRFIARRGMCHTLISDNGTNFVGADKILRKAATEMMKDAQITLAANNINWEFIPPGSPHFGGIWEAAVKSMKRHLIKIIGSHLLNVEEMFTLLAQVEACLNSRPLTPLSTDPRDLTALTPGHFLTGENLFELPDENTEDNITRKWQLVQRLKRQFWQRWSLEYLTTLQQRAKWFSENRKIKLGDLVLIKYENCTSTQWPLGRIEALHPGRDGLTRVVTIKTKDAIIKRPITKICPLPSSEEDGSSSKQVSKECCSLKIRPNKRSQEANDSKGASKLSKMMITLLTVLVCIVPVRANYTIKQSETGIYVEHVGQVQLIGGQLRMCINVSSEEIATDMANVRQLYENISRICEEGRKLHQDSRCRELVQQLNQGVTKTIDTITPWIRIRTRRGILGNILQGIFGVNDEVYADIDKLDENQKHLIEAMKHQGNLLLTTTLLANDTRHTLTTKINLIIEKINHVSNTLNDMSLWYKAIDQNSINLQFLVTYQLALGWLEQVQHRYELFYKFKSGIGSIIEACSPRDMKTTLAHTQSKLGSTVFVEPKQIGDTQIITSENGITILGFFPIVERKAFELVYCTGIPHSLGNGSYSVLETPTTYIGVNYDDQVYFELTSEQLGQCKTIAPSRRYCEIRILRSISDHPNCVVDEIYNRINKKACRQHRFQVKTMLWKQLARANTWLFLSTITNSIAINCNGRRQDVQVKGVGILEFASHCSVVSSTAIIRANPQITNGVIIQSTYIKPIRLVPNDTTDMPYQYIPLEPIIKQGDSFIPVSAHQEALLRADVRFTSWRQLNHHTVILGSTIGLGFLAPAS